MEEKMIKKADFNFLGSRNYVQAASIVQELVETTYSWEIGEPSRINAAFHFELKENGELVLLGDGRENLSGKGYCARFRVDTSSGRFIVGLRGTGENITKSVPYDEEKLLEGLRITPSGGGSGIIHTRHQGTPFNILVAMAKKMHEVLLPLDDNYRWITSGFDLMWDGMRAGNEVLLEVKLVSGIRGGFTRSSVEVDGSQMGYIVFTKVRKG